MHSVKPKMSPTYLDDYKIKYWDPNMQQYFWRLSVADHARLMGDLASQFGAPRRRSHRERGKLDPREGICGYCEQPCVVRKGSAKSNTVDHFFPQSGFNERTFEWGNLMYSCKRCNDAKQDGRVVDSLTEDENSYVNPREPDASMYFSFCVDGKGCRMTPNKAFEGKEEFDKAERTIRDFALDAVDPSLARNLPLLRGNYLSGLSKVIARINREDAKRLIKKYSQENAEFSSMVTWAQNSGYFGQKTN